jgi:hypothetical protein
MGTTGSYGLKPPDISVPLTGARVLNFREVPVAFGGEVVTGLEVRVVHPRQAVASRTPERGRMDDEQYIIAWVASMFAVGAYYGGRVGAFVGVVLGWLYSLIRLSMRS